MERLDVLAQKMAPAGGVVLVIVATMARGSPPTLLTAKSSSTAQTPKSSTCWSGG
jgi:hypothetical protein